MADRAELSVIVYRNRAYVETLAITDMGVYMGVEPVYAADISVDELSEAMEMVSRAGNPKIPHPTGGKTGRLPQPILKAAKVGSWTKLARGGAAYGVTLDASGAVLYMSRPGSRFEWDHPARTRNFPPNTNMREIARAILDDAQSRPELKTT